MILASTILAFAEGGGLLSVDGSILIIFILFIALVPLLNRILIRPITRVLDERERLTDGTGQDGAIIHATIEQKLAQYEEGIRSARNESYKVLESKRADAAGARQALIDGAKAEAERKIVAARAAVESEATSARATLEAEAFEIAKQISASLLGRAAGGKR